MAWKNEKTISRTKRVAARALTDLGVPVRKVAKELGIGKSSVSACALDPTLDDAEVERVKAKIAGRMVVSADRFLTHGLDNIQALHPYQAVLCAGIMHDHYLRSQQSSRSTGAGAITNILIQIDQSLRSTTISSLPPTDPNAT